MERISFQGRNLATAHRIWQRMLEDDVTIFLRHGRRSERRRAAAGRRAPDPAPLRRLPRLDRREPVSRSARDPRPAPLRRLAARRRRGAGRGADRSRVRHLRERGGVLRERQVDCRVRRDARAAAVHDTRVPLPARRASLEDDRARRHPDRRVSRERADLLSGDRRFVDRNGAVAGAPESGPAPARSTPSATSSSRRTS